MKELIPLTKIGFFNPGRLNDQEIEDLFVARVPFFRFLLRKIVSEKPSSIPQQHLIIGQRGMGKSALLTRIAAEIRKPEYNENFIALSFPEEQYNIDRLSKFWLNCLDSLADALDKDGKAHDLLALDNDIAVLSKNSLLDPDVAFEKLSKWAIEINRRPILLVDNLNLIFSKISKEDQHKLRAVLMSKGAPILVGASSAAVNETVDYQAPFYDAFQISYLNKLSFQESFDVLFNLAKITGNNIFQKNIFTRKSRLHALYQLTGGTPRTLAILFPLVQNGFSDQLQTDLDALLDMVTPLYKARFEELPPQLQVVLDAVALNWDPITLQKLREVTMLDNPQLSPQLKRLVDIGWLQRLDAYKAKGGAFEVNERFFNIWYLMRRSSRRQKRELYCLTKFLESFYGNDLRDIALLRMNYKSENADHIALDLALADAMKDDELKFKLRNKGFDALIEAAAKNKALLKEFIIPDDISEQLLRKAADTYNLLTKNKQFEEAKAHIEKILVVYPEDIMLLSFLAVHEFYINENFDAAKELFKKIISLNKSLGFGWSGLGDVLNATGEFETAIAAYSQAIKINSNNSSALKGLAEVYIAKDDRYKEAEKLLLKVSKLDPEDNGVYISLGQLYTEKLKMYHKAEASFKKACEIDPNDDIAWYELGDLYRKRLNKFDLAEQAYLEAIKRDERPLESMVSLSVLYMNNLKRYAEAEKILLECLKIEPDDIMVLDALGHLYTYHNYDFEKARTVYEKSIEVDPGFIRSYIGLGILFSKEPSKEDEAEAFFKKAVALSPDTAYPKVAFGTFYQNTKRFADAERYYLNALEIEPDMVPALNNLASLYIAELGRYDEAETLLKKVRDIDKEDYEALRTLASFYLSITEDFEKAAACFEQALKLEPNNYSSLNTIGNLNSDYLDNYQKAEDSYRKAMKIDPENEIASYNLIFLLRDKLGQFDEARKLFGALNKSKQIRDSYLLNQSLFAYYDKNIGIAEKYLSEAMNCIENKIPELTIDDWYRAFAVIFKLNYVDSLLGVFRQTGYDIILKPLYIALEALGVHNDKNFITSVAAEIREPAERILEKLERYLDY